MPKKSKSQKKNGKKPVKRNVAKGKGKFTIGSVIKGVKKSGTDQLALAALKTMAPAIGSALGEAMKGKGLYMGNGSYEAPTVNGLIRGVPNGPDIVPSFGEDSDQGVVITRKEFVTDVYAPADGTPFSVQTFPINPGLEMVFPWLSQVAANYDEYEFLQLIFTFKAYITETVTNSTGQVGTIILATNYNSAAPSFSDKNTMMQYDKACSTKVTGNVLHGVECDPTKLSGTRGRYVRSSPVVVGQDIKTYDWGSFQIGIANIASVYANLALGELWVSYKVRLRKPKFFTALGSAISRDVFVSHGGEGPTNLLGTDLLSGQQNNIKGKLTCASNVISYTFPAWWSGLVRIVFAMEGSGFSGPATGNSFAWASTSNSNVVAVKDIYATLTGSGDSPTSDIMCIGSTTMLGLTATTGSQAIAISHWRVNPATRGVNNTVTFTYLGAASTISQVYFDVSEYNGGFSYAKTGLGTTDELLLINSAGSITLPY